jgi:hypothetical protein
MNWNPSPETHYKYVHVRSDAASMRHTVTGDGSHSMSLRVNGTAVISYIQIIEVQNSVFLITVSIYFPVLLFE